MLTNDPVPDCSSSPIHDPITGATLTSLEEKFANQYDHQPQQAPDNPHYEEIINHQINSEMPNPLNKPITMAELEHGMSNLKSNAIGRDKIHNTMLCNLSPSNRGHLLQLLNCLLQNKYVPPDWKHAIIVPLAKPNKPPDQPASYRPITLTS